MSTMKVGIVGLPNVGKSTLFNALTRSHKAEAKNYPFCTIEPNVGIVEVPDGRLQVLQRMVHTSVVIPAAIEFVDIAGLVRGASQGEGLGNQFLAHIREVDVIVHVVRCFEDGDIVHSYDRIDPVDDAEIINTELILADLQSVQNQLAKNQRKAKSLDPKILQLCDLLRKLEDHLDRGRPARSCELTSEEAPLMKQLCLLSAKPVLYACNVDETSLLSPESNGHIQAMKRYLETQGQSEYSLISARLEEDLGELSPDEERDFLADLGIEKSGLETLIQKAYQLLGLASFFTAGEQEVRAWTFTLGMKAPACAGLIHGDFERGFIKAEVISYDDLVQCGSFQQARQAGRCRLEGRDYAFRDGDVVIFRFN